MSNVVYRMYDADEVLLYVGSSTRRLDRIQEHGNKPWWHEVDIITVEHFDTGDAALDAERTAYETEAPRYNQVRPGRARPCGLTVVPEPKYTGGGTPVQRGGDVERPVRMRPDLLRSWRELRRLTVNELADLAGVQATVITLIEERHGMPLYRDAVRITEALGIPVGAITSEVAA